MGTTTDPAKAAQDAEAARRKAVAETLGRAEEAAKVKRYNEATGICQDLLEQVPGHPPALALLGAIAGHRGDMARAVDLLEQAVAAEPNVAAWHSNLSGLYRLQYRIDAAVAAGRLAVKLRPDAARYHVNLGKALIDANLRDEAIGCFMMALAREASNAEAHLAIGQVLLARGEMRPGWIEYEWRNQLEQAKGMLPPMAAPAWNGMALPRSRLLLVADQGYGDTIQFCRYVPLVADRAAELVLGCSPDLQPLLKNLPGIKHVSTRWNEIPPHVAYVLLSSLPGILGTEMTTIPAPVPYLAPEPADFQAWSQKLAQRTEGRRPLVGLVWAGRPTHPNDSRRSLALADLAPLAAVPGVNWVSLQKVTPQRDAEARAGLFGGMIEIADDLTDFSQTAAVIANLDLLITVDSAVCHLAGALNKPVWVMMPEPADWRWLMARPDSPWYPSMRMFRQPTPGDWKSVIGTVAASLASVIMPSKRAKQG